jgi:predicted NBD/HSP70 family sugar kinase
MQFNRSIDDPGEQIQDVAMTSTMFEDLSPAQRQVLETIWRQGPIARHEIAHVTGLTGASITRLTRDLEAMGLVTDTVARAGARGQPARPVSIASGGAYALGVNFSHSFVDIGLVNLAGEIVVRERVPLSEPEPLLIARIACEGLERLRQRCRVPLKRLLGAGFSVPGDFRVDGRFNAHAYFPQLAELDLRTAFSSGMPVPVIVENDAASAALGERIHGAGVGMNSFMLVHIGHGVGSGLILDGALFRGAHDNAGMIGVAFPMGATRPSGQDLFDSLAAAGLACTDFDQLANMDLAQPAVSGWIARAGRQLADGLYQIARVIDPEAVILGGRLPPAFQDALFRAMPLQQRLARDTLLPAPAILQSTLGPYAGVIGAAAICFFQAFFRHR